MNSLTDHPGIEKRPPRQRSAVSNGKRRFVEGDGRSPWARRRRDLEMVYADDLGGHQVLSGVQLGLVEVAATLRLELERQEGRMSSGESVDLDGYARVAGHYRRICESLGIERAKRDVTPTLDDIVARHRKADGAA